MDLNFGSGKSEGLIRWRGAGAQRQRALALQGASNGVITRWVFPDTGVPFQLRIVQEYKHLGTNMVFIAASARDIACRLNAMDSSANKFIRHLFPDDNVPDARKLTILATYLLSRGLFHLSTWPVLLATTEAKNDSRIMRMYRHATSETWGRTSLIPFPTSK